MVLLCQLHSLGQFLGVQGDGFFTQDVLSGAQCLAQIGNVGIVGRGDINNIHLVIVKHIVDLVVHLFNAVTLGKGDCLFVCAVGNGVQLAPVGSQRLRQLVGNYAAAKGCPFVFLHVRFPPCVGLYFIIYRRRTRLSRRYI